ncbi:MAG: IMPACT family protein [Clostridia bacterium]|nr:IMPACT family protein [Clostridia bacterium]
MAYLYTTLKKEGYSEQVIEKSRFITHAAPVSSREEAEKYIEKIRAQYRDATHNVPAFVLGDKQQTVWGSDDGEPGGTAGSPVALLISSEGLTNAVVVVTRYFGGIKLGPGGLVRAYTSSARMALEDAGRLDVFESVSGKVKTDYSYLGKIQTAEKDQPFTIDNIAYEDKVILDISYAPEDEAKVLGALMDICSGSLDIL